MLGFLDAHLRWIALVTICAVAAACGGDGSTRVCFGSTGFCGAVLATNRAPEADAGPDLEVTAGDLVSLDGGASRDRDGGIDSYSWTQQTGPAVALTGAAERVATFEAPPVVEPTLLGFRLVVVDGQGASDSDEVVVLVLPAPGAALRAAAVELDAAAPTVCPLDAPAPGCWSYLGLWLGARLGVAAAMPDVDATALLDAVRVLEITLAPTAPVEKLPDPARRAFELGQRAVAAFAEQRDPATAERARRLATGSAPRLDDWEDAVAALEGAGILRDADRRLVSMLYASAAR